MKKLILFLLLFFGLFPVLKKGKLSLSGFQIANAQTNGVEDDEYWDDYMDDFFDDYGDLYFDNDIAYSIDLPAVSIIADEYGASTSITLPTVYISGSGSSDFFDSFDFSSIGFSVDPIDFYSVDNHLLAEVTITASTSSSDQNDLYNFYSLIDSYNRGFYDQWWNQYNEYPTTTPTPPPTPPTPVSPDNPCNRLTSSLDNTSAQQSITDLKQKTGVGNKEWGTEIRLSFNNSDDMSNFNVSNSTGQIIGSIRESTSNSNNTFSPNFQNGDLSVTIGYLHSHPDFEGALNNSVFSPADVLFFRDNYCGLNNKDEVLKKGVGVAVTATAVYAMNIIDPTALCSMTGTTSSITEQFRNLTDPNLTNTPVSQEQAFQQLFGDKVRLFKQDSNGKFVPRKLDSNGNAVDTGC